MKRTSAGSGGHALLDAAWALVGARNQLHELPSELGYFHVEAPQHPGGTALSLAEHAQQDVFGADVVMPELQSFSQGQLEDLLALGVKDGDAFD